MVTNMGWAIDCRDNLGTKPTKIPGPVGEASPAE